MSSSHMLVRIPMHILGLSTGYAAALGWLERKFPSIKPDHIWAEVAGGVLLSLVPVALAARQTAHYSGQRTDEPLSWQTYEYAVWRAFVASGTPIILWQLGEAVVRHTELLSYNRYQPTAAVAQGMAGERSACSRTLSHKKPDTADAA